MQNAGVIYGYARVSAAAQGPTAQRGQLKHAGCERACCERITGTHAERPRLRKLLASLDGRAVPVTGWSKDSSTPPRAAASQRLAASEACESVVEHAVNFTVGLEALDRLVEEAEEGAITLLDGHAEGFRVEPVPHVDDRIALRMG